MYLWCGYLMTVWAANHSHYNVIINTLRCLYDIMPHYIPSQSLQGMSADSNSQTKKTRTPLINPSTRPHHVQQCEDSNDGAPVSPTCIQNDDGYIFIDDDNNGFSLTPSLNFTSLHLHKNISILTVSDEASLTK